MREQWKPVRGVPAYNVSNLGRVRSRRRSREPVVLAGWISDTNGYRHVWLCTDAGKTCRTVHTLVCEAFHGPRPRGHEARHLDGDSQNNRADNLRWGTPSQNRLDSVRHGTHRMVQLAAANRRKRLARTVDCSAAVI
ncbi:NUMOD4 motif-containing protein [Geodermatophilus siccatus]|uniref:NUMOD4 motif-containing protein n=1 Tax=Geodermatophilus siccatus TaxID=1137991 RepID=A0A1H0ANR7_9ACTN|nr:HNH endonuclease signature motif containing protein [Geodermatophilus siccatus]SDN35029.1 NUMOD4 motif-containing protein [Geodermatophilus siccatus]